MINYPAIFRALLMGGAALFLVALVAAGLREASQLRTEQIARMAEAARRPPPTNALPMQGGWGCPAPAEEPGSADAITRFSPADGWIQ